MLEASQIKEVGVFQQQCSDIVMKAKQDAEAKKAIDDRYKNDVARLQSEKQSLSLSLADTSKKKVRLTASSLTRPG